MLLSVSIIICTRDRAEALRQTLDSVAAVDVPEELSIEVIVVDNGSTDHTAEVVQDFSSACRPLRLVDAPPPGLSRARNAGLRAARGAVILFTDDDVRVPTDWVEGMSEPILLGEADAVAGGVRLASHLRRDWMTPQTTSVLATTAALDSEHPRRMVGANMAIARHVLDQVPAFDAELGAGAEVGSGEETLFTQQLRQAGFRIASAFDVVVEHHCDARRLSRSAYRGAFEKVGRAQAYIAYHWRHAPASPLRSGAALALKGAKLGGRCLFRSVARAGRQPPETGLPAWERCLLRKRAYHRQLLKECRRPRNYARRGLVKRRGVVPAGASTSVAFALPS